MPVAHIVIDYQNIHLTGHGLWCPDGEAPHLCLVHPLHFATQVLHQRNLIRGLVAERSGEPFGAATLGTVSAFRGLPSNKYDAKNYQRSQAQQSEWTRDPRVSVRYRPLKYYPDGSVKEKGIDVLVALKLVTIAAQISRGGDDVVILAAHDTDQEPALELAVDLAGAQVETAGWEDSRILRVPGSKPWHTKLHREHFEKCRDLKPYA